MGGGRREQFKRFTVTFIFAAQNVPRRTQTSAIFSCWHENLQSTFIHAVIETSVCLSLFFFVAGMQVEKIEGI
jgi:hypothetical protein